MKENEADSTREFLNNPEISLWIDKYDDVFCDFDSRPFNERALSDDFIREIRRMASEKLCDKIEIKFNVFSDTRNEDTEAIIIKNLNTHFKNIADALRKEQRASLYKGYKNLGLGSLLILVLSYLTTIEQTAFFHGIVLMLEPVGWFMTWSGLDQVFQISRKNDAQLDFTTKMSNADIAFTSLEMENPNPDSGGHKKMVIPIDASNLRVA